MNNPALTFYCNHQVNNINSALPFLKIIYLCLKIAEYVKGSHSPERYCEAL